MASQCFFVFCTPAKILWPQQKHKKIMMPAPKRKNSLINEDGSPAKKLKTNSKKTSEESDKTDHGGCFLHPH